MVENYEKEPLVSLEEAIKPLRSLVFDVEQMVSTVKQNCQHPANHLSSDESASIMLYTLQWTSRQSSFYFILNKALRSQKRQELLPWFLYLRLFMFALSKVPPVGRRIVYRGIRMDVGDEFSAGKTFIWWAFSSCSVSVKFLEEFLGKTRYQTIFHIECDSAKDISEHSFYQNENEVLLYPARQFQVISSLNTGNQGRIIHLKEIQPRFPLIHIPPTSSTYQNQRLQQLIDQCDHRSKIDLSEEYLTDEDMEIVVREAIIKRQCKKLGLNRNQITSVGASIIAEALNNNTTLENLYISSNRLCDNGVDCITKILSYNDCKIIILDLQNTGLTDVGAESLADMLRKNTKLKCLLLSNNQISDRGVQYLINVVTHHNTTLLSLRIGKNELISDLSVDSLVDMLKHNQTLNGLDIESCNLSEQGKETLRQSIKSKKDFNLEV